MVKKPLLVSRDMHLLDGHHRWFANKLDMNKIDIVKIHMPVLKALEKLRKFDKVEFKSDINKPIKESYLEEKAPFEIPTYNKTVRVFENPVKSQIDTIISKSIYDEVRFLIFDKTLYAWTADSLIHHEMFDKLIDNGFIINPSTQRFIRGYIKKNKGNYYLDLYNEKSASKDRWVQRLQKMLNAKMTVGINESD